MISRVAENCFWLNRYVERVETTARLVSINRLDILDAGIHEAERWKPVIVVAGEQQRFERLLGAKSYDRDEDAEGYLTWSEENPTSIRSSLAAARENARMTREVVSREMWETINTLWQWLESPAALKAYKKDRARFYHDIRRACAEFQGDSHTTLLHDEPFNFMRLGGLLERADQTARVMDVKHHWLTASGDAQYETAQESAQWMGLLRLCTGVEPFFKRNSSAPTGPLVVRFVIQDAGFPRSVLHCLQEARGYLADIDTSTGHATPTRTSKRLDAASKRIAKLNLAALEATDLHAELTTVIAEVAGICNQAYSDFFDPTLAASHRK